MVQRGTWRGRRVPRRRRRRATNRNLRVTTADVYRT